MSADPRRVSTEPPAAADVKMPIPWRSNLVLFLVTAASVFATGVLTAAANAVPTGAAEETGLVHALMNLPTSALVEGGQFAGTLLAILVAHELGHWVAARIHKVDASLPFFIPMPLLSPFGTMGAVIRMRGVIPTRRALLDIGAAGPLAGLVFALPLYAWGVAHSELVPGTADGLIELGESVLTKGFDRAFSPAVPEGMLLVYSPVAFGAWGGLFVTMINLLPVGQLDGGHVAYALFGPKQDAYARLVHRAMLVFFCVAVLGHVGRDLAAGRALEPGAIGRYVGNALFWLVWFQVLAILGSLSSRRPGDDDAPDATAANERPKHTLTPRVRILVTLGLVFAASNAHDHPSWLAVTAFFVGLAILVAMERMGGVLRDHALLDHPPTTGDAPLGAGRKLIAIVTLAFFALLFMPEPFSM